MDNTDGARQMLLEQFLLINKVKKLKELYTRVLKGHIAVVTSKVNIIQNGHNLDKLARRSLNSINLNYKHGTGHGVGFFKCT